MDALSRMLYFLSYYEQNTTNYKTLVTLLQNIRQIPEMSIQEVADMCFVSTATISRLVQDMDFDSYSGFKAGITAMLNYEKLRIDEDTLQTSLDPCVLAEDLQMYVKTNVETLFRFLQPEYCRKLVAIAQALKRAKSACFLIHNTQMFFSIQKMLFLDGKRVTVHKLFEEGAAFAESLMDGDVIFIAVNEKDEMRYKVPILNEVRSRKVITVVLSEMPYKWENICDYLLPPIRYEDGASCFLYDAYARMLRTIYTAL